MVKLPDMEVNKLMAIIVYLGGFAAIPLVVKSFVGLLNSITGGKFNDPTRGAFDRLRTRRQEIRKGHKESGQRRRFARDAEIREFNNPNKKRGRFKEKWAGAKSGSKFKTGLKRAGMVRSEASDKAFLVQRRFGRKYAGGSFTNEGRITRKGTRGINASWETTGEMALAKEIEENEKRFTVDPRFNNSQVLLAEARNDKNNIAQRTAAMSALWKRSEIKTIRNLNETTDPSTKVAVQRAINLNKDAFEKAPDLVTGDISIFAKTTSEKAKKYDVSTWELFMKEGSRPPPLTPPQTNLERKKEVLRVQVKNQLEKVASELTREFQGSSVATREIQSNIAERLKDLSKAKEAREKTEDWRKGGYL